MRSALVRLAPLAALVVAFLASGCYAKTQRFPRPMPARGEALPPGTVDLYPAGPEEVLIVRHSDPVQVRPPGAASAFPLHFYDKQIRLGSGGWVFSDAGGRVEVIFPSGPNVILYGRGTGVIGSPSRGEPIFVFRAVERARITLKADEQIELLGGAILTGADGPYVLEHVKDEILRLRNRSKSTARLFYRESVFELDPGAVIDLPLLEVGTQPLERDPGLQTLVADGVPIEIRGALEVVGSLDDPGGTRLRAGGEHELRALGLTLRLDPGDEVVLDDLGRGAAEREDDGEQAEAPVEPAPAVPAEPLPVEGT